VGRGPWPGSPPHPASEQALPLRHTSFQNLPLPLFLTAPFQCGFVSLVLSWPKMSEPYIYCCSKKRNPLKYGYDKIIKLGNEAPKNNMYQKIVAGKK
jgi:hypothetical protein